MCIITRKILLFLCFPFLLFLIFVPYVSPNANAQEIFFEDNFDSGKSDKWQEYGYPNGWTVDSLKGKYVGSVTPLTGDIYSIVKDEDWSNFIFEVDVNNSLGADKIILFRVNTQNQDCYALNLRSSYDPGRGGDIYLYQTNLITHNDRYLVNQQEKFFNNEVGQTYKIKVITHNDGASVHIIIYVNGVELINVEDSENPLLSGSIGLYVYRSGIGATSNFDNILIYPGYVDIFLNVPIIKQSDPSWGSIKYDHADIWSPMNDSISRWGCALTSATMVLNYFNYPINVPNLNEWLVNQPDGYLRNGLVNWLAISRYSKEHSFNIKPILKYKQITNTLSILNGLTNKIPSIIGQNGHFFVAKGKSINKLLINDPFYSKTLINFDELDDVAIGQYEPTSSDLSYIMIVNNSNLNLYFVNAENRLITQPIIISKNNYIKAADDESQQSLPVSITYIQQPNYLNDYQIILSGPSGKYFLDIYLYSVDGKVRIYTINGYLFNNTDTNNLKIHFSPQEKYVTINLTEILNTLNSLYQNGEFRNYGYYNSIKTRLEIVNQFIKKQNKYLALQLLENLSRELIIHNNTTSELARTLLGDQILLFLNNLK